MRKKRSLSNWLQKGYYTNQYTKMAYVRKLRSRSWFKLEEINRFDKLFYANMIVLDLGSSPGGWSLYVKSQIGNSGQIIACDILPMNKIFGVSFFHGDCADPNFLKMLNLYIGKNKAQIVLSDMSPNMTGFSIIDINRSIYLGNLALGVCHNFLEIGGTFLVKVFQGKELGEYLQSLRSIFRVVEIRKPDASWSHSREVYIVAKEYIKCY